MKIFARSSTNKSISILLFSCLCAILLLSIIGCSSSLSYNDEEILANDPDWNDENITWFSYDEGLAQAEETGKPILIVFYTDWCPHCKRYSRTFHHRRVVAMSEDFVLIRVNRDHEPEINAQYAPDGGYVPRTVFLDSTGTINTDLHGPYKEYQYLPNTTNPNQLIQLMRKASRG